jgi:selenide,water dikinase
MPTHPWIDERTGLLDDAAVVRPEGAKNSLVLTMDVITPIVDEPRTFGAIAACNALSDVYAMGGRPELALSFLALPSDLLGLDVVREVLAGVHDVCGRARCAIVGGHTMKDSEPKCGLSVVGSVEPERVWSQRFAKEGDALVLTKAIGTGLVGQAVRNETVEATALAAAVLRMTQLNDLACELGRTHGVRACTDVTGFGLLGHLRNVVEASQVSVSLRGGDVPFLPSALELAALGCVPGGTRKNLAYAAAVTTFDDEVSEAMRLVLADAQTSGGLLLVLPAENADALVGALQDAGIEDARTIGHVVGAGRPEIQVVG